MKEKNRNTVIFIRNFVRAFADIYSDKQLSRASAALAYYLTMTLFPLVICLYSLLGSNYEKAMHALRLSENLFSAETLKIIEDFLLYVSSNYSTPMMLAGVLFLVTSASASIRILQSTIGEMQGEQRYEGISYLIASFILSLVFVAAMYFAITVMLTGERFLNWLGSFFPFLSIRHSWNTIRFIYLAAVEYAIVWLLYRFSMEKDKRYSIWAGTLAATVALVLVSMVYSAFLSASARYPMVYGSLASIILLMLWMYTCCLVIYCGCAFNIVLRDRKREKDTKETDEAPG